MSLEEIEKRLKVLEDIEEIKQLHVHYVNCLTTVEWDQAVEEYLLYTHPALACFKSPIQDQTNQYKARGWKEFESVKVHVAFQADSPPASILDACLDIEHRPVYHLPHPRISMQEIPRRLCRNYFH